MAKAQKPCSAAQLALLKALFTHTRTQAVETQQNAIYCEVKRDITTHHCSEGSKEGSWGRFSFMQMSVAGATADGGHFDSLAARHAFSDHSDGPVLMHAMCWRPVQAPSADRDSATKSNAPDFFAD